ncbi:MAG: ferrous iron transporter B [Fimbriimonadaceae bacterium]
MSRVAPLASASGSIAVVGNPNAGKTTIFNALTGARQKVANYPGVTVERVSGALVLNGISHELIDVPGLYSLRAVSEDERVASAVIRGESGADEAPALLVCVLDASSLERNLYLYAQIAELGLPTIVALTMVDRLEASGRQIDANELAKILGTRVVKVVGHKDRGVNDLKEAVAQALSDPPAPQPHSMPGAPLFDPILARTKEPADVVVDRVPIRYAWAAAVAGSVISSHVEVGRTSPTDRIDRILTHRVFGLAIFGGVMYLVFQSIYTFAQPLMDAIKYLFDHLSGTIAPRLEGSPILKSFICDGLVAGLSAMLQFLPQILILFFFISFLEGTGYLARAAFLMDRLLGWCGLNGRAFIPLLSSFACAIPGIMAARVMPDARSRLATILVAPLMSCSARLPVYIMLIGAFIEPRFGPFWAGFTLFAMHLLGLAVAVPIVWILNRTVIKGHRLPFVLELPPYQMPKWRDIWLAMYFRARVFVTVAGTTIVMTAVVVWTLSYFPRSAAATARYRHEFLTVSPAAPAAAVNHYVDQRELSNSFLGRFGRSIEPAFAPAGFDWRITTAILAAFPARENVVPALGIIFSLGHDVEGNTPDMRNALREEKRPNNQPLLTPFSAVGLMIFFALCCQCMSTLATTKRETNSWKWPIFMFTYMTALAYAGAVAANQIGHVFGY